METTQQKIVTRLAPSPTGFVHVGSLYMALFNYLLARKNQGTFLIRIEDTDRERYVEGAIEGLIRVLNQMGLDYDEGPVLTEDGTLSQKGPHGPYIQSERLDIYREHVQRLVDAGHAYYCFCTKERLEGVRAQQQAAKQPTKYDRTCAALRPDQVQTKLTNHEPHVIRMKIPEGETTFQDVIRGTISIKNSEIDDQVLMKSDGFPTYHLAVVVDDHAMGVTHIIRGEEWISSVPKHLILYSWFGFPVPTYVHLPLILNPDKSKLSKRQGDVAVEDFLKKGYLPEALLNFVALLGFNPGGEQEIYSIKELMDVFELSKLNKSGAVFNVEKLNWMNGHYVRSMDLHKLMQACRPYIQTLSEPISDDFFLRILKIERERIHMLSEITDIVFRYLSQPSFDPQILVWKKSDASDAKTQLEAILNVISAMDESDFTTLKLIESTIKEYIEHNQLSNGNVLWPLRVALSGAVQSPSPFELLWILQKQESINRINHAIQSLSI